MKPNPQRKQAGGRCTAFSVTEMVTTISIIGILATIVIAAMSGVLDGTKQGIAERKVEELNQAIAAYNQASAQSAYHAVLNGSTDDENRVLQALRSRSSDPMKARPGSPYVAPAYNPRTSSDGNEFRITWVGSQFKLLSPGTTGTGLLVVFDNSDMDGNATPPEDTNPLGK
jgi:type II secretory pathway pseudopilin PulG